MLDFQHAALANPEVARLHSFTLGLGAITIPLLCIKHVLMGIASNLVNRDS